MTKKSQMFFTTGKKEVLKKIFTGDNCAFGYVALGFAESNNGFEQESDFKEIDSVDYYRIPLSIDSSSQVEVDSDSGKVLMKFSATLGIDNIIEEKQINQLAVVDSSTISAETKFFCATTFSTFTKTSDSSITFILGFRI